MTFTAQDTPSAGVLVPVSTMLKWSAGITEQQNAMQRLTLAFGGNVDTATSGTWLTIGNVTVPTWATSAIGILSFIGVYDATAQPNTITYTLKIGTAAGATRRLIDVGVLLQRTTQTTVELISSGLVAGTQSVTVATVRSVGTGVLRADASSYVDLLVFFQ